MFLTFPVWLGMSTFKKKSKLDHLDFLTYIISFDIICLVETFVEVFNSTLFPTHTIFSNPALKLSEQGRRSGGVVVLVKKEFLPFLRQHECKHGTMVFLMNKECFGLSKDVLFIYVYIPPV